MAVPFRSRVHGKVLGAGVGLEDIGVRRALQAAHHRHTQLAGEVRVFAVGLHAAAPAGIPEDIDVGRPERKALVPAHVAAFHGLAVLDAGFVAHGGKHLVHQGLVKGGRHGNGHREHRGLAVAGHPVQGLVPPVVRRNAQRLDGGRRMHHQGGLLLQGHLGNQVFCLLFGGRGAGQRYNCCKSPDNGFAHSSVVRYSRKQMYVFLSNNKSA